MLKIQFTNARIEDKGYGLLVNGNELTEIISTALGTRVGDKYGYSSGLPAFLSSCCNVTIIIDPQPVTEIIETKDGEWDSMRRFMEEKYEQYQKKVGEAES